MIKVSDYIAKRLKEVYEIKNILNMDIAKLDINEKYDFIYCRHVI